jgi:hypothetical protein
VFDGDNSSCSDCAGIPDGDAELDNCGTCDNDSSNDCVQDCAGIWGGSVEDDECGVCGGDGSTCTSNTLSLFDNGDGSWNVNYVSNDEIGGFQFNIDGATINSAFGGAAGNAGFIISTNATFILGFSLTGATIPAGYGVLVVLDLSGTPEGLSEMIVSDAVGQDLVFTYDPGDGCAYYHHIHHIHHNKHNHRRDHK